MSVCRVHELCSYYGDYIMTHCDRRSFVAFGVASSLKSYRLDAESRELRVVVSRGPRAVARRAQRVRATRGPEAHYNAYSSQDEASDRFRAEATLVHSKRVHSNRSVYIETAHNRTLTFKWPTVQSSFAVILRASTKHQTTTKQQWTRYWQLQANSMITSLRLLLHHMRVRARRMHGEIL